MWRRRQSVLIGDPVQFTMQWTVRNQGTGAGVVGDWVDRVILSTDAILGNGDDRVVGDFAEAGLLNSGQERTLSRSVQLPGGLLGSYHLFVAVDARDQVFELGGEQNNTRGTAAPVLVSPRLYADLVAQVTAAPTAATGGERIPVTWTVTNQGLGNPNAFGWNDRVVLSADSVVGNGDDVVIGQFFHDGLIGVGASYTRTESVLVPFGVLGARNLFVVTDAADAVYEFLYGANNASAANPLMITLGPTPDLEPAALNVPATVLTAGSMEVSWTVDNVGQRFAPGPWVDRLYLSADDRFDIGSDLLLGSFTRATDLLEGTGYSRTETVALPSLTDGDYSVFLVTDANQTVVEDDGEGNNVLLAGHTVRVVHPDLRVSAVTLPAGLHSGTTVDLSWTVINQGAGATQPNTWKDRVYLSADPIIDAADMVLTELPSPGRQLSGASYTQLAHVALPNGLDGTYYFLVQTDVNNEVVESGGESNNVTAAAAGIQLSAYADLAVTAFTAPHGLFVGNPVQITLSWTVANHGTGRGPIDQWVDRAVLSTDRVFDGSDLLIGLYPHQGGLDVGASYSRNETIPLPTDLEGTYYVLVRTDGDNVVYEHGSETDNVAAAPDTLQLLTEPYADLAVTSVAPVGAAFSGQGLKVNWTVSNQGIGITRVGSWTDRLLLSKDASAQQRRRGPRRLRAHRVSTAGRELYAPGGRDVAAGYWRDLLPDRGFRPRRLRQGVHLRVQ